MSTPQDPWGRPVPPPYGQPPGQPPGQSRPGQSRPGGPGQEHSPWSEQGAAQGWQQAPPAGPPAPGQVPGRPSSGQAPYGQPPGQPPYPGQPSGQPPHPGQPPGPAPARSPRTVVLLVVGLVVAAVLLIGVVGAVVLRGDPRETAEEFMAALKSKDVDKAHGLLCDDGQEKVSTEQLRANFDLDTRSITNYVLGPERTRERDGNSETLIPVSIDYDQGEQIQVDLGLWNDGGQKVCSLNPPG